MIESERERVPAWVPGNVSSSIVFELKAGDENHVPPIYGAIYSSERVALQKTSSSFVAS